MTTPPKGKPYIIGSVKAWTSKEALKKARKKFPGKNVSVKLYAKGKTYYTDEQSIYNVYSKRGVITGRRG